MKRIGRIGAIAAFAFGGWTAGAAFVAAPAAACNITPGMQCAPDLLTVNASATHFDQRSGTITAQDNTTTPPTVIVADYTENVYQDPDNNLCGIAGKCLTWVLQVTNRASSTDTIARVTVSNFAGWTTETGINTNGAPGMTDSGSNIAPDRVSRSSDGKIVRWDFGQNGGQEVGLGQTTRLLEIQTNATQTIPGTVTVQDGVAGNGPGLSPAIPETLWVPAIGLFGGAVAGGYAVRRRRIGARRSTK